jgi:hypothetical protein
MASVAVDVVVYSFDLLFGPAVEQRGGAMALTGSSSRRSVEACRHRRSR